MVSESRTFSNTDLCLLLEIAPAKLHVKIMKIAFKYGRTKQTMQPLIFDRSSAFSLLKFTEEISGLFEAFSKVSKFGNTKGTVSIDCLCLNSE